MGRLTRTLLTPKRSLPAILEISVSITFGAALLLGWCVFTYGGIVSENFLPPPHMVVMAFVKKMADGSLPKHIGVSLSEIYLGFVLASVAAIPIGIFMGSFRIVAAAIEPIINFIRYLPVTSMIPLLILWIGIGLEEKVAVIFIGTFFQQVVMVADVSARVPRDLFDASYTLGASWGQVVTRVLLPATLPGIMDTLRVTMGWAWTFLVVAELVAADAGLGYMILQAMRGFHPDVIFVGILVIGILGLLTDRFFKWVRDYYLSWASTD